MQGRKLCLLSVCSSVRIGSLALRSASWGILTKNRSVSSIFARVLVATPQFLHRRVGEGLQRRRIGGENEDSLSADEGGGRWNRQAMPPLRAAARLTPEEVGAQCRVGRWSRGRWKPQLRRRRAQRTRRRRATSQSGRHVCYQTKIFLMTVFKKQAPSAMMSGWW